MVFTIESLPHEYRLEVSKLLPTISFTVYVPGELKTKLMFVVPEVQLEVSIELFVEPSDPLWTVNREDGVDGETVHTILLGWHVPFAPENVILFPILPVFVKVTVSPTQTVSSGEIAISAVGGDTTKNGPTFPVVGGPQGVGIYISA